MCEIHREILAQYIKRILISHIGHNRKQRNGILYQSESKHEAGGVHFIINRAKDVIYKILSLHPPTMLIHTQLKFEFKTETVLAVKGKSVLRNTAKMIPVSWQLLCARCKGK
jgi:hypothetical protein